MENPGAHKEICGLYGRLLSYPGADLPETAGRCRDILSESSFRALGKLGPFLLFVEEKSASGLEELYTATFDLQPLCHPYVGYQLCGESRRRTLFLLGLKELYREHGFEGGSELPDHLAEMLFFLASATDREVREEIVIDAILPALEKLLNCFEEPEHPYGSLLGSLQAFLLEKKEVAP